MVLDGDLADLPDAPRQRSSPPCVALQASECQADPNRAVQYTLVPEQYRDAKGLLANASVCTSRFCHRHVGLLPEAGQPGRPKARKRQMPDDTAADGHMRGPSPSHRQRPTVVNTRSMSSRPYGARPSTASGRQPTRSSKARGATRCR